MANKNLKSEPYSACEIKKVRLNVRTTDTYIEGLDGNSLSDRWHSSYHVFDLIRVHFIASIRLL